MIFILKMNLEVMYILYCLLKLFICVIAILSIFMGNLSYYAIFCCLYNSYFGLFLQILTLVGQEILRVLQDSWVSLLLRLMWEVLVVGHGILRVFQVSWTGLLLRLMWEVIFLSLAIFVRLHI